MAVKIRMKRVGRTHRAVFRVSAVDSRRPRDGAVLEELGVYDPANRDASRQVILKPERIQHWLSLGAVPSPTVASMLKRFKISHG